MSQKYRRAAVRRLVRLRIVLQKRIEPATCEASRLNDPIDFCLGGQEIGSRAPLIQRYARASQSLSLRNSKTFIGSRRGVQLKRTPIRLRASYCRWMGNAVIGDMGTGFGSFPTDGLALEKRI
jgi:hypothetical protein